MEKLGKDHMFADLSKEESRKKVLETWGKMEKGTISAEEGRSKMDEAILRKKRDNPTPAAIEAQKKLAESAGKPIERVESPEQRRAELAWNIKKKEEEEKIYKVRESLAKERLEELGGEEAYGQIATFPNEDITEAKEKGRKSTFVLNESRPIDMTQVKTNTERKESFWRRIFGKK